MDRRWFLQATGAASISAIASPSHSSLTSAPTTDAAATQEDFTAPDPADPKSWLNDVKSIEHVLIPMPDGKKLAARLWLPDNASASRFPAVFEFIPYRKRDHYRAYDEILHPYYAGNGYACVRVDLRGTGDSEGQFIDEYHQQELDDAYYIISWIAKQNWCDGNVGMMGISWGGFNSLQTAAMQPPALKAVLSAGSTDDRYTDDVHYMGGWLLNDNFSWATTAMTRIACPPDPVTFGSGWRDEWRKRIENLPNLITDWLEHQRRDEFWRHGSINEDYSAIKAPVFLLSGWADGYTNPVFRMLENLNVPRRAVVGPWGHNLGYEGAYPGPFFGFLQETLQWWDHWLKGVENGVMDAPQLSAWMQENTSPDPNAAIRPGRWVGERSWPAKLSTQSVLFGLTKTGLKQGEQSEPATVSISSPCDTGLQAGNWSIDGSSDQPGDQRIDDAGSLLFDTAPLEERVEILGAPEITLEFEVDKPVAMVCVRLNAVSPSGESSRLSYGLRNLCYMDSFEKPRRLKPGKRFRVTFLLNDLGQALNPGDRLRIAISTAYWPIAWPAPERVNLVLHLEGCSVSLPIREPQPDDANIRFHTASLPPANTYEQVTPGSFEREFAHDYITGNTNFIQTSSTGVRRFEEIGLEMTSWSDFGFSVENDDPLSAIGQSTCGYLFRREHWEAHLEVKCEMTSTAEDYMITISAKGTENGKSVAKRRETRSVKRDHT